MSLIGIIGDVHSSFDALRGIMESNPEVIEWFQVGDLGSENEVYPELLKNFHFIQGNHENWDYIDQLKKGKDRVLLRNGTINTFSIEGKDISIASLGGNYSSKFYSCKKLQGGRRRHFTEEEYNSLIDNRINYPEIDILLTHEAPSPFFKGGTDIGSSIITNLVATLKPTIHFFGHHHIFKILDINDYISVGLEYATKSYVLYNLEDNKIQKVISCQK